MILGYLLIAVAGLQPLVFEGIPTVFVQAVLRPIYAVRIGTL